MDGQKSISLYAPENINFKCKNMNIEVQESMTSNIGQDQITSIGSNKTEDVGETIETSANELRVNIDQNADINIGEKLSLPTNETDMFADGGDFVIKCVGKALVQGAEDARISKG